MPLHDWKDDRGWDSVHLVWLAQLLDWVQPRLPEGYRAYLRQCVDHPSQDDTTPISGESKWHEDAFTTSEDDPYKVIHVDLHGRLVAVIEVVSPRNKDRPSTRKRSLGRYVNYLRQGVHLLLIDLLPRPAKFSFADAISANVGFAQPACPAPCAVSYRVGNPTPKGTLLALWRPPLEVGKPLPTVPLNLDTQRAAPIDLEHTYREAARRAYLD